MFLQSAETEIKYNQSLAVEVIIRGDSGDAKKQDRNVHLHFEVVESIVMLCEECQSPDTGEEEWYGALCISQNLQQGIAD